MTATTTLDSPRTRHSAAAVAVLFFVNGATFSNWLPRIPEIRDNLGLGNAGLGVTLLGGGLGGIVGALVVGKVMDRLGSRRVLTIAATSLSIGMPLIAFAPTAVVLLLLLTSLGVLDVCNDVAMNAQGVIVQQRLGRSIMNRLHAMWSLGFTGGALVGSAASAAGASVRGQLAVVGATLFITVTVAKRWLIPIDPPPNAAEPSDDGTTDPPKRFSGVTVLMALAALGAVALEVVPNDWAAVLMRDVFDFGRAAGFGTMACAGAMLVGRLGGDHVLDRIGARRLFNWAITLVGIGALITVTAPVGAVALVGLIVWGLGLSVVFPQLYATAARLPGVSAGTGLGSMLLGQRFGAMLTAVTVGAIAEWQNLRVAFAVVAGLAFTLLLVTSRKMMAASAGDAGDRGPTMSAMDENLITQIHELVEEEHHLEAKASPGQPLSDDDERRLRDLEVRLDQCWDLLRQRRARREAGLDPGFSGVRPPEVVEGYQQ